MICNYVVVGIVAGNLGVNLLVLEPAASWTHHGGQVTSFVESTTICKNSTT
jgi:hypothetical protein